MDYMKDVAVVYARLIATDKALGIIEDKINDLLMDTEGVSNFLVEVYDNVKMFNNRYEEEFTDEV